MHLIFVLSITLSGCATVDTRLANPPNQVDGFFPSLRLAHHYYKDVPERMDEHEQNLYGFAVSSAYVCCVVIIEFPVAAVTDVVLLPMDGYFVWRKSANERQEREGIRDNMEEKSIEQPSGPPE